MRTEYQVGKHLGSEPISPCDLVERRRIRQFLTLHRNDDMTGRTSALRNALSFLGISRQYARAENVEDEQRG